MWFSLRLLHSNQPHYYHYYPQIELHCRKSACHVIQSQLTQSHPIKKKNSFHTLDTETLKTLSSPTFSSFSKCSRRNFIGRSGLAMQRFTMHSLRICWMLCFCTKISQPFKLSSSSRVEEEVAILSFISVAVGEKQGGPWEEGREARGG